MRGQVTAAEAQELRAEVSELTPAGRPRAWVCIAQLVVGVALLAGGAHTTVVAAVEVAKLLGWSERVIGLINDDATPVGQVHLGIVHLFELAEPSVRRREAVLTESGFAPLTELRRDRERFETWSQFLLADGVL